MRVTESVKWTAVALIALTGLIHLVEAPEYFAEHGAFWGLSFLANAGGAAVAAYGISRGAKVWGWALGALVAGGAIAAYLISRTVGLPGLPVGELFEATGIASLLIEAAFLVLFAKAATARTTVAARSPR
ncbi:Hypothetical Protein RradSPS_2902 (plasmid) [Rubrobacter radiotolerans]|uniref:Uncharacterized protein n=1 Tax=Rubrobacter radiotolerans TaxID=42256 RepID=A0A023X813_RUBRA|nr:hypothetical protein [Rubrobacter radiotolerans]AHY48185.1 Hypothetical Protein RradSPS_2902 [Rubrobacter radiotolerans]MDX5895444.1 hypothetical protein [Rubrobacter radiotolerans]SMC01831.1 conserved hypothetical protein [Rubrobacter radiotolerans DSM 5868]